MRPFLYSLFLLILLLGCSVLTQAQVINTIAGNGYGADSTGGYSGDGGPATAAEMNSPASIAVDGSGNVYIADDTNSVIRKVNTLGIINTIAGNDIIGYNGDGMAATAAELSIPYGVAVDGSGNVYIADTYNNRIRKVNTSGIISTIAGNGTEGYSGDGTAATAAEFYWPSSVAIDGSGNVYIADLANSCIRKVNTSGVISTIAGNDTFGYTGDGMAATAAELNYPICVAVDGSGNVYIADEENNRIRKVNTSGIISTIAGNGTSGYTGDGIAATATELNYPDGVTVDGSGNIYIADQANNRIRKVNTTGIISTIAGNGIAGYNGDGMVATAAELYYPWGVAVDGSGNVYIADQVNNRIRKVTSSGTIVSTVINSGNNLSVYPNPGRGVFSVMLSSVSDEQMNLTITNIAGEKVKEINGATNHVEEIRLDQPAGIYILSASTARGTFVRKIIVK